ncbi:hypothetical protein EBD31_06025 [Salmonella enterica subsp. enterica serovar Newport]|nr:hypothetical protein [Salmonella enterica subsp. enterica serovar Newport]ECF2422486.1 hypothetical protein [Salmonella enterica subsp. enterica serovar Newport]
MVKVEFIFTSLNSDTSVPGKLHTGVEVDIKSFGLDTPPYGPAHVYGRIAMHKKREILKIISDEFNLACESCGFNVTSTSVTPGHAGNDTVN